MAPLRDKLIHVLASLVAIDLAVAGVIIDARSGSASTVVASGPQAPAVAGGSIIPGAGGTGILGAATFHHRRGSFGGTTATSTGSSQFAAGLPSTTGPASSVTTGAPASIGTTSGSGRSRSTGGSGSTGGASGGQAGRSTTPSTGAASPGGSPAGATGDPAASPGDGFTGSTPGDTGDPTGPSGGDTGTTSTTAPVHPTGNPPAKGPANLVLTDKTGDTVGDTSGAAMAAPRADIVKAQADWSAKALVFAVQVAQPVNPGQDPNWANDSTYIQWDVDTNGDGAADYTIQYFFDPKGGLVADITKAGDTSGQAACGGEAGYTADGYTVAVDPAACFGNPPTVTFRATTYYNVNPSDPNSDSATDTTPDGGQSGPVSKP